MDRVTEATQDCLSAIIQLRQLDGPALPPPETLHARLRGFVDTLLRRAADLGFAHPDAQDMAYALVALMDETALAKPAELRDWWMGNLLQFHFFQENLAGDGFFQRLNQIRNDPKRHEVLQVYYLCLVFGFQGRYRIRGGELELMGLTEAIQAEVRRAKGGTGETLSPHGERPNEAVARAQGTSPVVWVSAAALLFAVLVYGGLRVTMNVGASNAAAEIAAHKAK